MRFLFLAPVIQYGKYGCALTLEQLGRRWGMGQDEGLESLSEEQYHFWPAKASGILWMLDFQFALRFSQRGQYAL